MTKIDPKIPDVIKEWLILLGNGCTGKMSQEDARVKVQLYTTMLAAEFPISAFTQKSLAYVLKQCTFFPSCGELMRSLNDFLLPTLQEIVISPSPMPLPALTFINRARPADDANTARQERSQAEMDIVSGYVAQIKLDMARNRSEAVVTPERTTPARLTPEQLAQARREAGIVIPNPSPL